MNNKDIWTVSDMLEYALQIYNLADSYKKAAASEKKNYERQIRRTLEKEKLVEKNLTTKNYNYSVSQKMGKYVINELLKKYFIKHENDIVSERAFQEMDEKLNQKNIEGIIEEYDDKQKEYIYTSSVSDDDMNQDIDRFMLRAIFDLFYDFDEEQYRKDYYEKDNHIDTNDNMYPYQEGYSKLNYKLKNPIVFYCKKK